MTTETPSDQPEIIDQVTSNAVAIFSGSLDDTLSRIAAELKKDLPDISTKKGREEIASRAYKAARCKTKLDNMGKELNVEAQSKIDAVNEDRKRVVKFLDGLRDEIRKPLDDWESAEKKRTDDHAAAILALTEIYDSYTVYTEKIGSAEIMQKMHDLDAQWKSRDWEEFAMRAENVAREMFDKLKLAHETTIKNEADQAELAKLRAAQAIRDEEERVRKQKERDEEIARNAAESTRKAVQDEADRKAKEAADAAAKALEDQKNAAEEAKQKEADAIERAAQAERDRIAAAKKAEDDRIVAAQKAEDDRVEAAKKVESDRLIALQKAEKEKSDAVEAERKRVAADNEAIAEAARKRQENLDHRSKINNDALQAFAKLDCVLGEVPAKAIVIAIAKGEIPHVRIEY